MTCDEIIDSAGLEVGGASEPWGNHGHSPDSKRAKPGWATGPDDDGRKAGRRHKLRGGVSALKAGLRQATQTIL